MAEAVATRAFEAAVTLHAVAAVQTTRQKVAEEFAEWYEKVGQSLLFRFDAFSASADEPDDESEESEVEDAKCEKGHDEPVVRALAFLSKEAELKQLTSGGHLCRYG